MAGAAVGPGGLSMRPDGGETRGDDVDEAAVEALLRRAIRTTYPPAQLERVDYVDVHYERHDAGDHLLRARAPDHDILALGRWLVVTLDGREVHFRGDGRAGATEFYVRARIGEADPPR